MNEVAESVKFPPSFARYYNLVYNAGKTDMFVMAIFSIGLMMAILTGFTPLSAVLMAAGILPVMYRLLTQDQIFDDFFDDLDEETLKEFENNYIALGSKYNFPEEAIANDILLLGAMAEDGDVDGTFILVLSMIHKLEYAKHVHDLHQTAVPEV